MQEAVCLLASDAERLYSVSQEYEIGLLFDSNVDFKKQRKKKSKMNQHIKCAVDELRHSYFILT